jgi:hypothetical protein
LTESVGHNHGHGHGSLVDDELVVVAGVVDVVVVDMGNSFIETPPSIIPTQGCRPSQARSALHTQCTGVGASVVGVAVGACVVGACRHSYTSA